MYFLDLLNNPFIVSVLDLYFFITILLGCNMMFIFFLFSEENLRVMTYVSVFTILNILGLISRLILMG